MDAEKFFLVAGGCAVLVLAVFVVSMGAHMIWADIQDRATCERHEGVYTRDGCFILGVPRLP